MRGRIKLGGRWRMTRRQGGYSLPSAVAERLEGALRGFGNRDAAAALARLLALAHRRTGRTFACCRRALAQIAALGLSEDQIRRALAVLAEIGFLDRIGGGAWDRERQKRRPVIWRLGWAARKSPTEALRAEKDRSGGNAAPKPLAAVLGLRRGLAGLIPSGGEIEAVRTAARQALNRLRGAPLPGLSAAALTAFVAGKPHSTAPSKNIQHLPCRRRGRG